MTFADEMLALPVELLADFGTTATYVVPSGTDDDAGAVTEAPVEHAVNLFGPVGDSVQAGVAQGAQGTFYLPASGLTFTPKPGHRLVQSGRTWLVRSLIQHAVAGVTTLWELSCAEHSAVTSG